MSIANYTRIKVIGKGAFGEAVLIKSKKDGELYVSKEIQLSGLSEKDLLATKTEISILARIDHPNITRYIESFQEGDTLYIILEYADGGDLHHMLKKQVQTAKSGGPSRFPEHVVRNWFVQLCLAMQHLHSIKILHRDLKTRNVFLTKDNQVKLGDFGLSTVLKNTMANAKTMCGTPYYFSPELCRSKPYNSKSDVWALGCILYEMCTLKHAFDASDLKGLMQKILKGSYPPISSSYSKELSDLITKMLVRDPSKRPSVTQILEVPFMQDSLKLLRSRAEKRTAEEEAKLRDARLAKSQAMEAAKAPEEKTRGLKANNVGLNNDQVAEMREMKTMDRNDLKAFLKGPAPKEEEKPAEPAAPAAAAAGAATGSPAPPPTAEQLEVHTAPTVPGEEEGEKGCYTHMRLPEKQYDTLTTQVQRLTVEEVGKRCAAAETDDVDTEDPEALDIPEAAEARKEVGE